MIKILTVDDHSVVREGIKQIVSKHPDMIVAGEASNYGEFLNLISKNDYDIILLDISMPGRSGLDILNQIKKQRPNLPVLILSIYPEEQLALRTLKIGGSGYLTKESAPEELVDAIRKVASGGRYISLSLAEKLTFYINDNIEKPLHEKLSNREYQVMCMIASGKTTKEIAKELSLSVNTISTNRARILKKMKMKTNAELTFYAISHGLTISKSKI